MKKVLGFLGIWALIATLIACGNTMPALLLE